MLWNYGFSKKEGKYETYCGLLTCVKPSKRFEKGGKYAFYYKGGYANIIITDLSTLETFIYPLDCYEGGTYKIVGTLDELEDAEFVEGVL